jgi:urease alpha subunit
MKEITPDRYRCLMGECPSTFKLDDGRIVIIGKKAEPSILSEISGRIGRDEDVIVVEAGLLETVFSK